MSRGPEPPGTTTSWRAALRDALSGASRVDVVGVGNELRSDDAAGLKVASALRARLRKTRVPGLLVHPPSAMPERLLSKLARSARRIIILDAVEAGAPPGDIICAPLGKTKYGFFVTHNVPLKLVPGLAARADEVYLVGVQPKSLEVGEGLSTEVLGAVERVVEAMVGGEGGRR